MTAQTRTCKRILLIDDDFTTRECMSVLLAAEGYRVAVACNGADALERLRGAELPDLILLDLRMPVMDGETFCEHWRQTPDLASIPLVVISGLPDAAERAARLGATACLQKPIDNVALLLRLRECGAESPPAPAEANH
jgi:CheY-like chemotaxis protein